MHLLASQAGALQQEGEAIDLGQTPGRIVFATAADSELAAMAAAVDRAGRTDVRIANVLRLAHNYSVDTWLDDTVRHADIVVVRLLGGPTYWPYGVDELTTLANQGTFRLALLPGDPNPDPVLLDRSTVADADWHALHALFTAGGPDNMDRALAAFAALADGAKIGAAAPTPFPRFGLWWPGEGIVEPARLRELLNQATSHNVSLPLEGRDAGRQGGGRPEGSIKHSSAIAAHTAGSPVAAEAATPTPDPSPQGGGERTSISPNDSLPPEGRDAGRQGGGQPEGPSENLRQSENRRHLRFPRSITRARALRGNPTEPERRLWPYLREFRSSGFRFRRQVPIGRYIADFVCHHPKLVIELDGDTHAAESARTHDADRDDFIRKAGYRVVRFANSDVMDNMEAVWDVIAATLSELHHTPNAGHNVSLPPEGRDAGRQGGGRPEGPTKHSSAIAAHTAGSPVAAEAATPTPDPSPQGGGEHTNAAAGHNVSLPPEGRAGVGVGPKDQSKTPSFTPVLFYRAALEGAGAATVNRLVRMLVRAGLNPVPMVISTLKEGACLRFAKAIFAEFPPATILNLTGFALGLDGIEAKQNPFAETDAPLIQLVQTGRSEKLWETDSQGLSAKDLAMQVVLPELDGRIGMLLVGHKQDAIWHEATQCPLQAYAPDADGIARAVELARNWTRLRRTPRAERKVAIVLANYPIRDGRIANGVGYDAPQSTVEILKALGRAGYDVEPALAAEAATPTPDPSPQGGGARTTANQDVSLPLEGRAGVGVGPQGPSRNSRVNPESPLPLEGRVGVGVGPQGPKEGSDRSCPETGNALIEALQQGPTNAHPHRGESPAILPLATYEALFAGLPDRVRNEVTTRWGDPSADPFCRADGFHLPVLLFGNAAILLQPSRGYDLDEDASYHDPDLVPPHAYCAAYLWLRHVFGANAVIHNGKHGNLEWLPGKATALDAASYPLALWGALPHLYPFIVNDPGEGTQAKRRTGAVIIDHLVPPLTRAETYGPLKDLEALLDEYYAASGMDRRRLADLRKRILAFTRDTALDRDIGLPPEIDGDDVDTLNRIDTFLCDLKEAQIRDGLHIFGQAPQGDLARDLTVALARVPRGEGAGEASLIRAIADDLKLGFDPLTARLGDRWRGPDPFRAQPVNSLLTFSANLHTIGDAVERLEALASRFVEGAEVPAGWPATSAVMHTVRTIVRPRLDASGPNEIKSLLDGLDGKFVAPGPAGAPSRGRLDVLPTGRNFYSVDNRAVPTPTAWELGRKSAENLIRRHFQDHGNWLKSIALSVWGTANMRTGGDDIAQALALIGAKPKWDPNSLRVSGYEIAPLARLGRPRVDVTLRISGFFRDAFPGQIALFDRAVRAIGALDEPEDQNPIAARMRTDALSLMQDGQSEDQAALSAGHRIFGSKPGAYGAGLQGLIDSGNWHDTNDIARAFLDWGQYAYGARADGVPEHARFRARLSDIEAVVHNQDNREHDVLDSDDYYQFEGGLTATAEALTGRKPLNYHNDHSRPERPLTRTLEEEIARVMRSRVVNPKWISGVMRHGYKGAFEIIATVDYMFAFAATTGAVKTHHFDLAFSAFVEDEEVQEFIRANNPYGYDELLAKFRETIDRGLWTPKSNSAYALVEETRP